MTAELTKCMGGDTVGENEKTTLELIHNAAKAEFMEKGFREASLRNIAKSAGVTTGALYGYYGSKEELFKELQTVTDHYNNEAILTTIDIPFRIKDLNSMLHNYERYYYTKEANRVFNDILGFRSVYTNYDDVLAMELPEQFRISDMSHGKTIDDGYRGVHLHYQMDEFHYPIEIQFNTAWDLQFNQWLHKYVYKKSIPNIIGALLRRYYENGKIKSETDFKEVLNGGIFNRKE